MMKKLKMLWMPVLLGGLLMATLVGVAGARPNAGPEGSPALMNHMISAHRCSPAYAPTPNQYVFQFGYVECYGLTCGLVCPIKPPHEGLIRVQRLAMYAYDNDGGSGAEPPEVCIWLTHTFPKTGGYVVVLRNQCTTDNAADPQVITYNPANFKVSQLQDLHVHVKMHSNGQKLYGFKLRYEPL
jgi:hypothetical protein